MAHLARQHLAFLFWPNASEAPARANLCKALFELRRVLPSLDHFIQAANTTIDVELFTARLSQAEQARQPEVAQAALEQVFA